MYMLTLSSKKHTQCRLQKRTHFTCIESILCLKIALQHCIQKEYSTTFNKHIHNDTLL